MTAAAPTLISTEAQWRNGSRVAVIAILSNGERVRHIGRSFAEVAAIYGA